MINWYTIKQKLKEAPTLTSIGMLAIFIVILGQMGLISSKITSSNTYIWVISIMVLIGVFGTLSFFARKFEIVK